MPEEQTGIVDWMNLPHDLTEVSLWAGLHDANCVHPVQPAGAHRYSSSAKRPLAGIPQIAAGYAVSPAARRRAIGEEEARLIAEYQSKCREESLSWNELESAVTSECNQVIDIADASLVTSTDNSGSAGFSTTPHTMSYFCAWSGSRFQEVMGRSWELQHSLRWQRSTGMRSNAGIKRRDARPETSSEAHSSARDKSGSRRKGKLRDAILPIFPQY